MVMDFTVKGSLIKRPTSFPTPPFAFAYPLHSPRLSRHPSSRLSQLTLSPTNTYRYHRFNLFCTAKHENSAQTRLSQTPKSNSVSTDTKSTSPPEVPLASISLLLLNFVTVLWGTQHAVIKLAIENTPPATLNLSRFLLAALISLPSLPKPTRQTLQTYLAGTELSLYLFLGYALQSISLLTTSASRSGFLLYLNVKFVPLFARFLYRRPITPLTWASAALALCGTALLTYDGSPPSLGDVWSVLAAAASAMFILRLESASQYPPKAINAISLTSVSILCAVWLFATNAPTTMSDLANLLPSSETGIIAVLYLGIVTTALSNYLQTLGQRHVPAERAAVIFAMDPVYGAFFASALLGESLGARGIAGAACIAMAAIFSNSNVASYLKESQKCIGQWLRIDKSGLNDCSTMD